MTVNEINKKFKKIDETFNKIERLLNNASTGVDFYNAYITYKESENGSPEQGFAILDIFSSAFDFGSNVLPPLLGGAYMDAGSWFMETIESDVALQQYWDNFYSEAIEMYAKGELTYQEAIEYADNRIAELIAAREAIKLAKELNQVDQVFYDIGLFNPVTGEIDLTVYNNWEDVLKKYAEDNFLSENGLDEFAENLDGVTETQYENWRDGCEIIKNRCVNNNVKKVISSVEATRVTRYGSLVLDLDGDDIINECDELLNNLRVWTIAERPKSCPTQWTS